MDPLSGAGAFATIVGLMVQFFDQRKGREAQDYEAFKAWLAENRHEQTLEVLEQNANTLIGIKVAFSQNHEVLIDLLQNLDRKLASLAASTVSFGPLAAAIHPDARISGSALDFLRAFDKSGSGRALEIVSMASRHIMPIDNAPTQRANIEHSDARFFEDDIATLAEMGLLRLDTSSDGRRMFIYTRAAADLVKLFDGERRNDLRGGDVRMTGISVAAGDGSGDRGGSARIEGGTGAIGGNVTVVGPGTFKAGDAGLAGGTGGNLTIKGGDST